VLLEDFSAFSEVPRPEKTEKTS